MSVNDEIENPKTPVTIESLSKQLDEVLSYLRRWDRSGSTAKAYPKLNNENRIRLTRTATFGAWVGRPDSLVRLANEVERVLREAYETSLADNTEAMSDQKRQTFALRSEVFGAKGRTRRSGAMQAMLAEMDLTEIEYIYIGNGREYASETYGTPQITIVLTNYGESDYPSTFERNNGVFIGVTGDDNQWVGGVLDVLVNHVKRNVPWWEWVRKPSGSMVLLMGTSLLVVGMVALAGILVGVTDITTITSRNWALLVGAVTGVISGVLANRLRRWVFKGVEVLEPGLSSITKRFAVAIATISGLILGVAAIVLQVASSATAQ
jgi:hypothetical protein